MIVDVHDSDGSSLFLLLCKLGEKLRFRLEVALHRTMKIEVILSKIGKNSDIPLDTPRAIVRERMRRNFHGGRPTTGVDDLREKLLQVEGFRRCASSWQYALTDFIPHRSDQATTQTRPFTDVLDKKG